MKKLVLSLIIVALFAGAAMPFAGAANVEEAAAITQNNETIQPRAEVTEWCYRSYQGQIQKRLWSVTYGYWLTDWIDC